MPEILAPRGNDRMHSPGCGQVWPKRLAFREIVEDHQTRKIPSVQLTPNLRDLFRFRGPWVNVDACSGPDLRDDRNNAEIGRHPVDAAGVGGAEPVSIFDGKLRFAQP